MNDIRLIENGDQFFENSRWIAYSCSLPVHLGIRSDSAATLIVDATPGEEIEIRILTYNRRTGDSRFAAQRSIDGETGAAIIDFRWLVRRYLDWYLLHGSALPEISETPKCIVEAVDPAVGNSGVTVKQTEAIATILRSRLSYIWGPPGTGKTKWVLAKVVFQCVKNNQKVLILASTNITVDTALTAILDDGADREDVIRLGIPSQGFLEKYPECCGHRAFQQEIKQIDSQIRVIRDKIAQLERAGELKKQVANCSSELNANKLLRKAHLRELAQAKETLNDRQLVLMRAQKEFDLKEEQIIANQHELDALAIKQLAADIETLEGEQIRIIVGSDRLRQEFRGLGVFARLLTKRKKKLISRISAEEVHLQSVEATLKGKLAMRDAISPKVQLLKGTLVELESVQEKERETIANAQNESLVIGRKCGELEATILKTQDNIHQMIEQTRHQQKESNWNDSG